MSAAIPWGGWSEFILYLFRAAVFISFINEPRILSLSEYNQAAQILLFAYQFQKTQNII